MLYVSQNKLNYWTLKVLIDIYGEDIFRALSAVKNRNNKKCFYTVFSYMKHVEKYLKKCLDSLVNQTLDDIEIIIIDDKSPDNSALIIDEYKKKYDSFFPLMKW